MNGAHEKLKGRTVKSRRGVAAVEFAVCLPVLVILVFGSIQASSFIFLKQSLHAAAYESARQATRSSTNHDVSLQRGMTILNARGVVRGNIDFSAANVAEVPRGRVIEVSVSAPTSRNTPLAGMIIPDRTLTTRVTMVKE